MLSPPPKIDHFLCFEKDAVHYCKKQMCICWGRHSSAVLLRTVAKLNTCQGCNAARLCKTAAPGNLKFPNFKSFQDTAQVKLPNYRPGKASLLNCRHCRLWLQNRLGTASAPTLQGFAKLQPLPTCQSTAQAKVPNYRPGKVAKLPTCKVPTLQGQLQHCKTFQASLLNCRALARLQNCQPARAPTLQGCKTTALANLANLPKFQHCRLPTCCKVCQTTNKAAKSKLQGFNTAGASNCQAFQVPSSLLNCRARLQTTTSCQLNTARLPKQGCQTTDLEVAKLQIQSATNCTNTELQTSEFKQKFQHRPVCKTNLGALSAKAPTLQGRLETWLLAQRNIPQFPTRLPICRARLQKTATCQPAKSQ